MTIFRLYMKHLESSYTNIYIYGLLIWGRRWGGTIELSVISLDIAWKQHETSMHPTRPNCSDKYEISCPLYPPTSFPI